MVQKHLEVKDSISVVDWKIKKKELQKKYCNKGTKPLVSLQLGEMVRLYHTKLLKWEEEAIVKEKIAPRSCIVETKDKARYRRNRKHLQKITKEDKVTGQGIKDQKEKEKISKYVPKQEKTRSSEL